MGSSAVTLPAGFKLDNADSGSLPSGFQLDDEKPDTSLLLQDPSTLTPMEQQQYAAAAGGQRQYSPEQIETGKKALIGGLMIPAAGVAAEAAAPGLLAESIPANSFTSQAPRIAGLLSKGGELAKQYGPTVVKTLLGGSIGGYAARKMYGH